MIFVTLGTQDKSFKRLLDAVQKEIDLGNIKDEVVVQAGFTKYESKDMQIFDLLSKADFDNIMSQCDLLITHGGVGSIINGLKLGKRVIAVSRLAEYKEHINDHQKQIVNNFNSAGYIIGINDIKDFPEALKKANYFKPKKYKSNTRSFINNLEKIINEM